MVPNQKQLTELAKKNGIEGEWTELCNHKMMEEEVLKVIKQIAVTSTSLLFLFSTRYLCYTRENIFVSSRLRRSAIKSVYMDVIK